MIVISPINGTSIRSFGSKGAVWKIISSRETSGNRTIRKSSNFIINVEFKCTTWRRSSSSSRCFGGSISRRSSQLYRVVAAADRSSNSSRVVVTKVAVAASATYLLIPLPIPPDTIISGRHTLRE